MLGAITKIVSAPNGKFRSNAEHDFTLIGTLLVLSVVWWVLDDWVKKKSAMGRLILMFAFWIMMFFVGQWLAKF